MLLRSILSGRALNRFLLGKSKEEDVPCRFCGGIDGDDHLFWDCPFPSFVRIREHLEFVPLMMLDRGTWPRCLAWHGWLPELSPRRVQPPWAVAEVDSVDAALETALGAYPVHPGEAWRPEWDPEDISDLEDDVPGDPNIWTDGSRNEDLRRAGAYVQNVPWVFNGRTWGRVQDLDLDDDASRIFSMVPGFLQTVQRREYWGVILALQAFMPIHLGIDNKNVCNSLGRIIADWSGSPFSLCTDGDLLHCIISMVLYRSASSVRVSKVKGHATEAMVVEGKVRKEDKDGNDAADIAADFGRLRQPAAVIDARRNLLKSKKEWYPRILSLHRFLIAIARESLNHSDGGSAIDPLCWDLGSRTKVRRVDERVVVEFAKMPGPGFLDNIDSGPLTYTDISLWPFSVHLLVRFTSFLSTLRWPEGLNEMGRFGVSYLEVLILLEQWVGHRLLPEKTVPIRNRSGRKVILGSPSISEGVSLRVGCQFIGSLFRSLSKLPGGLRRFISGGLGPHLSMLRHLGWLQCGHGLTCRPVQSSMLDCLNAVLGLLGYPAGSVADLANGVLKIRFCCSPFAGELPSWRVGSGLDAHRIMTSKVENLRLPLFYFSPPFRSDDGGLHAQRDCVRGDLSLPGGVDDAPRGVRRRISRKTSTHDGVLESGPAPKRRKRLSLPGPTSGCHESSYFPRVGVG